MKAIFLFLSLVCLLSSCDNPKNNATSENADAAADSTKSVEKREWPSPDTQIKMALLAAPKEKQDSCTVYGYASDKQLTILRQGTNGIICLGDNPDEKGFSVACYAASLEPFMKRGRELRKEGISGQKLLDEREKEVKAGTLKMPEAPATLYVYTAKDEDVNTATGEVKNGYLRYVIYIPFATAASTGLPEKPSAEGMPWIMNPGTSRAHIMINPKQGS